MSHLETIAQAAYQTWVLQFTQDHGGVDWTQLSRENQNSWLAIAMSVLSAARSTGVL